MNFAYRALMSKTDGWRNCALISTDIRVTKSMINLSTNRNKNIAMKQTKTEINNDDTVIESNDVK